MNIDKYEELVNAKKMKIVKRQKIDEYEVYISEGFCRGDADDARPHYKMMYAIAYDSEHLFQYPEFFTMPVTIIGHPDYLTHNERIKHTIERAAEMISAHKENGCLRS